MIYQITQEEYTKMLEILPPAYMSNGLFQIGEPHSHSKEGLPMYATYKQINDEYYEVGIMDTNKAIRDWEDVTEIISEVEESEAYQAEEEFESLDEYDKVKIMFLKYDQSYTTKEALESSYEDVDVIEAEDEKELGEYVVDNGLFGVEIPDALVYHINYESIGRDYTQGGYSSFECGGTHYYCNSN